MIHKNRIAIGLIGLVMMIACDKVPFSPNVDDYNDNLLVVDAIIGNYSRTIKLSCTAAFFSGKPYEMVSGAVVEVACNEQSFSFKEKEEGVYVASDKWIPEIGNSYTLKITIDGEIYEANSTMRQPANMHSINVEPDDDDWYKIKISYKDNEEKDEHFVFKYTVNNVLNDSVQTWTIVNDKLVNNTWWENIEFFDEVKAKKEDTIKVINFAISENYYRFLEAAQKDLEEPLPFTSPAGIPIEGNISNGALGFFEVTSSIQDSAVVKE
jgi:hypothetical protein